MHAETGIGERKGLPWSLVSLISGASAHDHNDRFAAPKLEGAAKDLPENVIPLRLPGTSLAPSAGLAAPDQQVSPLVEADPTNPEHQPTPIFGRAALHLPEWPTVLVACSLVISLLMVVFDSFRGGMLVFGASMGLAFFFRLVLTDRDAGMLKVRSRGVDLLILGLFALSITLLAFWVPTTG